MWGHLTKGSRSIFEMLTSGVFCGQELHGRYELGTGGPAAAWLFWCLLFNFRKWWSVFAFNAVPILLLLSFFFLSRQRLSVDSKDLLILLLPFGLKCSDEFFS